MRDYYSSSEIRDGRRRNTVCDFVGWVCLIAAALTVAFQASRPDTLLSAQTLRSPTALSAAIETADRYYDGRTELENVRRAILILKEQVRLHPKAYAAWWRIAKYDCYLARQLPDRQQSPVLEDGIKAGKTAESIDPGRPDGHFWTGAAEGLLAEAGSFLDGLRLVDPIRNEMQTVLKLDPDYAQDGAERILGRLYYEAPFFKGGNKKLSVRILENCLERYPNNSLTMLYLADSYRATGRRADARNMLERVVRLDSEPGYGPELAHNRAQARRELERYFHRG